MIIVQKDETIYDQNMSTIQALCCVNEANEIWSIMYLFLF